MNWHSWSTLGLQASQQFKFEIAWKQSAVYKFLQRWCFFQNETRAIR